MKRKIWELMNSAAMQPVMFCSAEGDDNGDDEGGAGGAGDDNGGTGGKSGDGKGADGGGEGDKSGSKLAGKGLFSQRKAGGDSGAGNGDGGNDDAGKADDGKPKIPEKFLNKDGTPKVDDMAAAYTKLEKEFGDLKRTKGPGGGEVPATAEEYFADGVKLPDTVDKLSLEPDDPGLMAFSKICKEEGIGKDLAGRLLTKMFVEMNDFAPEPIDPEKEMSKLGKGGEALVDGLFVWIEGMERTGELSVDDIGVVEGLSQTADGIRFLAKLRNMTGEKPIPINPGAGVRGISLEQLDEQYKDAVKRKDYKEQERLDELRNQVNPDGTGPGISSR